MDSILGTPDSTSSTTEPNRHTDGVVDSLWAVHYPGLTSSIRVANGTDFPETIVVTKSGYVRTPPLGVDIAVSDSTILRILGRPAEQDSAHLVYVCSDGAEEPVTFELSNGKVSKISIARYVD